MLDTRCSNFFPAQRAPVEMVLGKSGTKLAVAKGKAVPVPGPVSSPSASGSSSLLAPSAQFAAYVDRCPAPISSGNKCVDKENITKYGFMKTCIGAMLADYSYITPLYQAY